MRSLFLLSLLLVASCVSAKFPVHIFIESLCPDSIRFIQNQLKPVYAELKEEIQVSFVPFGKAESQSTTDILLTYFDCHHGQAECEGNMLQSCALYLMDGSPDTQMDFMTCQMDFDADRSGLKCLEQVNFPSEPVENCVQSSMGLFLQLAAEQMTKTVHVGGTPLVWVPTIVYNFTYDKDLNDQSQTDFRTVLKTLLNDGKMVRGNYFVILSSLVVAIFAVKRGE